MFNINWYLLLTSDSFKSKNSQNLIFQIQAVIPPVGSCDHNRPIERSRFDMLQCARSRDRRFSIDRRQIARRSGGTERNFEQVH